MAVIKGSMVVEFEYEEEDVTSESIEKQAFHWLSTKLPELNITHLEASDKSLQTAFGVGL